MLRTGAERHLSCVAAVQRMAFELTTIAGRKHPLTTPKALPDQGFSLGFRPVNLALAT
jgi:hypothetical protein